MSNDETRIAHGVEFKREPRLDKDGKQMIDRHTGRRLHVWTSPLAATIKETQEFWGRGLKDKEDRRVRPACYEVEGVYATEIDRDDNPFRRAAAYAIARQDKRVELARVEIERLTAMVSAYDAARFWLTKGERRAVDAAIKSAQRK